MITEGLRNDAVTRHCTATRELEDIFPELKTFHAPLDPPLDPSPPAFHP